MMTKKLSKSNVIKQLCLYLTKGLWMAVFDSSYAFDWSLVIYLWLFTLVWAQRQSDLSKNLLPEVILAFCTHAVFKNNNSLLKYQYLSYKQKCLSGRWATHGSHINLHPGPDWSRHFIKAIKCWLKNRGRFKCLAKLNINMIDIFVNKNYHKYEGKIKWLAGRHINFIFLW